MTNLTKGALVRIHHIYNTEMATDEKPVFAVLASDEGSPHGFQFYRLAGGNEGCERWTEFIDSTLDWYVYPHHCTADFEPSDEVLRAYGLYVSKGYV